MRFETIRNAFGFGDIGRRFAALAALFLRQFGDTVEPDAATATAGPAEPAGSESAGAR